MYRCETTYLGVLERDEETIQLVFIRGYDLDALHASNDPM